MSIEIAYSSELKTADAIAELRQKLPADAAVVLFFGSASFDATELAEEMQLAFNQSVTIGCSTAGEIISGKMLQNSIVAMSFDKDFFNDFKIEVLTNICLDENAVQCAFNSFEKHFKIPLNSMSYKEYVGLILIDGLSGCEEKIMDKIGDLTNVVFVGGSAGDDLQFKKTNLSANGKVYSNAALLFLMKPQKSFNFVKTQSFVPTGKILTVTKANESERRIIEFNNEPATKVYAEMLGVEEKDLSNYLFFNPLGLMNDKEPFVRSPQKIENTDIIFFCSMLEGMELQLLSPTNIVDDTQNAVLQKLGEMGNISGIIDFHCILRTLELRQKNLTNQYGNIFWNIPTVGFSTYGECYLGHINQTSTMLIFS